MCAHTHIHTKSLIFRSECTHSSGADPALLLMQWERKGLAISMNCSGFDKGTSAKKKTEKENLIYHASNCFHSDSAAFSVF